LSVSPLLALLLLQVGQGVPLPGNEQFADQMRDRPQREATPEENAISGWLSQCLDQIEQDASRAHSQAQIQREQTIGTERVLANHCLGLAATRLELWDDAQTAFTAARDETPVEELRTRARFGTMAGNAALAAGDLPGALALLNAAESDAESASEGTLGGFAAVDRGRVLVALQRPQEALMALEKATTLLPGSKEAWLYRATLLRRLDRLGEAQKAIETASDLAPMDPEIGLEAGVIAILDGRDAAARQSWQSIIDRLPTTDEAEIARGYLAQLGPEATEEAAGDASP